MDSPEQQDNGKIFLDLKNIGIFNNSSSDNETEYDDEFSCTNRLNK